MAIVAIPIRATSPSSSGDEELLLEISLPPLDELARNWHVIEPILKRATDRTRGYQPIDILQLVMLGRETMFVIREAGRIVAVAVTEVHVYPRCRVLEVVFIAGTGLKRWWRQLLDALDAQAEIANCADIGGFDRKGWAHYGFKVAGVSLVRRLKD